jgi:hypothetical protein
MAVQADRMFFGAPASLTVGGEESGTSFDPPKIVIEYETNADKTRPQGARSKIKGLLHVKAALCRVVFRVNEFTATKLGWVLPGASITNTPSVGVAVAGLVTTLAADPVLGATTIDLTSVTTEDVGSFLLVGTTLSEAASEVVRVVVKGTAGGTDTVIENSAGGGLLIDHGNGENVKTCLGTVLAAPAVGGDTVIKVDAVTGSSARVPGNFIRIGYIGHYETRTILTVGTAGAGGTGVTLTTPLTRDHGLDEWVIVVTALTQMTIQPVAGRVPSSAYKDVVLTGVGLDGLPLVVELDDALSLVNQDIPFSDDDWTGFAVELEAYGDPNYPALLPWRIKVG